MLNLNWRTRWSPERERCGLVITTDEGLEVVEVPNLALEPKLAFEMSAEDVEQFGESIVATWHSHTDTYANLSIADYELFMAYPHWQHIIVSETKSVLFEVDSDGDLVIGGEAQHD